jgi:hypothetical protein
MIALRGGLGETLAATPIPTPRRHWTKPTGKAPRMQTTVVGSNLRARLVEAGASHSSCGGISGQSFVADADGVAHPSEIELGAVGLDLLDDLWRSLWSQGWHNAVRGPR